MIQITITFQIILQLIVIDDRKWIQDFQKGTGYDYPDLPGLGNNNEKLGLPCCLPLTNMDGVLFAQEIILNFRRFKPFFGKNERDY
jgi:hypothetical protein